MPAQHLESAQSFVNWEKRRRQNQSYEGDWKQTTPFQTGTSCWELPYSAKTGWKKQRKAFGKRFSVTPTMAQLIWCCLKFIAAEVNSKSSWRIWTGISPFSQMARKEPAPWLRVRG